MLAIKHGLKQAWRKMDTELGYAAIVAVMIPSVCAVSPNSIFRPEPLDLNNPAESSVRDIFCSEKGKEPGTRYYVMHEGQSRSLQCPLILAL